MTSLGLEDYSTGNGCGNSLGLCIDCELARWASVIARVLVGLVWGIELKSETDFWCFQRQQVNQAILGRSLVVSQGVKGWALEAG